LLIFQRDKQCLFSAVQADASMLRTLFLSGNSNKCCNLPFPQVLYRNSVCIGKQHFQVFLSQSRNHFQSLITEVNNVKTKTKLVELKNVGVTLTYFSLYCELFWRYASTQLTAFSPECWRHWTCN